jgi:hypothetical protein
MLFLKRFLLSRGIAMVGVLPAGDHACEVYLEMLYRQALAVAGPSPLPHLLWRGARLRAVRDGCSHRPAGK